MKKNLRLQGWAIWAEAKDLVLCVCPILLKICHVILSQVKAVSLNGVYIPCFCKNRSYDDRTSCRVNWASSERVNFTFYK